MAKEPKKALIVGGYGGVGRTITARLADELPGRVVAAGRNYERASRLSDELQGGALPFELDISDASIDGSLLDGISLVVMCIHQQGTAFVEQCIRRGVDYIDITAGAEFLSEVGSLDPLAREHGSTVVLSVGLAPGVTNLLAKLAKSRAPDADHVDLFLILGLGERHGEAAVRWTVQSLSRNFHLPRRGTSQLVQPFSEGKVAEYPLGYGERRGYRFNLPEQHLLPASLGIGSAASWLSFDSALATGAIALMARLGLMRFLRLRRLQDAVVWLLRSYHIGSDVFIAKAEARATPGAPTPLFECAVAGYGEARATGIVAAKVALSAITSPLPSGVHHLEQLVDPLHFLRELSTEDIRLFAPDLESIAP